MKCETKREEIAGGWRILDNGELHNLYASRTVIRVIKSRRMRWGEAHSTHGRNAYNILIGKSEGKKPSGRPRRTWENNIRMDRS
jgi:hypothetical protein